MQLSLEQIRYIKKQAWNELANNLRITDTVLFYVGQLPQELRKDFHQQLISYLNNKENEND